jgi:hypothetical protein
MDSTNNSSKSHYCMTCGAELPQVAQFCNACGSPVHSVNQSPSFDSRPTSAEYHPPPQISYPRKSGSKQAFTSLLGGLGFIVLMAGIFLNEVKISYALITAFIIWTISGAIRIYWGFEDH